MDSACDIQGINSCFIYYFSELHADNTVFTRLKSFPTIKLTLRHSRNF
jgi:hypothetical protein